MDTVFLSDSQAVLLGLATMLESAIGLNEYVSTYVEIPTALLIVEVAKRAPDRAEWFPRGKWATIQNIQNGIDREMLRIEHRIYKGITKETDISPQPQKPYLS